MENKRTLNIAFIGAGLVNFGGAEGPWNHAKRIEQISLDNKQVIINAIAIADPFVDHAKKILENQKKDRS